MCNEIGKEGVSAVRCKKTAFKKLFPLTAPSNFVYVLPFLDLCMLSYMFVYIYMYIAPMVRSIVFSSMLCAFFSEIHSRTGIYIA